MKLAIGAFAGVLCGIGLSGCGGSGPAPAPGPPPGGDYTTPGPAPSPGPTTTTIVTTPGTTEPPLSSLWGCTGGPALPNSIANAAKKGLAVDDPTFSGCADKLMGVWPHAPDTRVKSLRLFAAWKREFNGDMETAWTHLVNFVHANNVKVLLGVEVKCTDDDDWMWGLTLQLAQRLGKEHILGIAIGNELDNQENNRHCWDSGLWNNFYRRFADRVNELDNAGFNDTKILTVWAMGVLNYVPNPPFNPTFSSFLQRAHEDWGNRFVWAFNPYPIWDHSMIPANPSECVSKTQAAISLDYTKGIITEARKRVTEFTGDENTILWVTESGWSSPGIAVASQQAVVQMCPQWASPESYYTFYQNIMEWDLSLNDGHREADHLFYFTMRDARGESFGLVSSCDDEACKIQGAALNQTWLI